MLKATSRILIATMLFSITCGQSCASLQMPSPPRLENRTHDVALDFPGFIYQYKVCVTRILGICAKEEMKHENVDWTDPAVRRRFKDMGFVLTVLGAPGK